MSDILLKLAAPFDPAVVQWRVGSTNRRAWNEDKSKPKRGQPLCYIDARDVMQRLDDIFGLEWEASFTPMPNGTTCCNIGLPVGPNGAMRWRGNGAGATGDESDENQREMAQKGAYSDALKRAAVLWGIGRYLYDIKAGWIVLDDFWQIPKQELANLRALLERNGSPAQSAYAARKKIDWKAMAEQVRNAPSIEALNDYLSANKETLASMPDNWRAEWDSMVGGVMDSLRARVA